MLQNNTKTQQVQTHMYQSKVPQARQVRQKWSWAVQLSLGRALLASAQQSLRVLGPECNPYFCDYDCDDKVMMCYLYCHHAEFFGKRHPPKAAPLATPPPLRLQTCASQLQVGL